MNPPGPSGFPPGSGVPPPDPASQKKGVTGPSDAGFGMKKVIIYLIVIGSIIGLPTFGVSNTAMDFYQDYCNTHKDGDFSKWLHLKVGRVCKLTLFYGRDRRSSTAFKTYCEAYPDDPERSKIMYEWALAVEAEGNVDRGDRRDERLKEAIDVLDDLIAQYPNTEMAEKAEQDKGRILHMGLHQ